MDCKSAQQMIMPYIEHKLSDRETEDFIEHVRGCKACSEELEVYFTIYYALEQLDDDSRDQDNYDMKELLERDLRQRESRVRKHNIMRFYRRLLAALAGILAAVLVVTAVQALISGSLESTTLYSLFAAETDPPARTEAETQPVSAVPEETERETNRKRQFVVTVPETEANQPAASEVLE